jgi:hypothetical protein
MDIETEIEEALERCKRRLESDDVTVDRDEIIRQESQTAVVEQEPRRAILYLGEHVTPLGENIEEYIFDPLAEGQIEESGEQILKSLAQAYLSAYFQQELPDSNKGGM